MVRGLYGILNWTVDLFFIGPINAWLVEFLVFHTQVVLHHHHKNCLLFLANAIPATTHIN